MHASHLPRQLCRGAAILLLAGSASWAGAQGSVPAPRQAGAVTYVCGGVGSDEAQAMKAEAGRYDLMLTFAASGGAYLADVDVAIRDARGASVLQVRCEGPLMLVRLPAKGSYTVSAQSRGAAREQKLSVGPQTAHAVFTWPAS